MFQVTMFIYLFVIPQTTASLRADARVGEQNMRVKRLFAG